MKQDNKQLPQSFKDALNSMRETTARYYDPELGTFYIEEIDIEEFIDFYEKLINNTLND